MRTGILLLEKEIRGEIIVPLPTDRVQRARHVGLITEAWSLMLSQVEDELAKQRDSQKMVELARMGREAKAKKAAQRKRDKELAQQALGELAAQGQMLAEAVAEVGDPL